METLESIRDRLLASFPGAEVTLVANASPSSQHSLLVGRACIVEVARWLREDPELRLDQCSNVTGIDWPEREITEGKVKRKEPAYLEVVYHLYSIAKRQGPVVLRVRTGNRTDDVTVPSLTPIWRSCELQEREVFDLFGVQFTGHPDLRRILMWDEFKDHPMRRDYRAPDDYEWEPTAHDDVLARAKENHEKRFPAAQSTGGAA
ncbi:NADH-quinone oxidoreductase subunit C [Nibricoccus sp. IMCC34717]|uniref:NADH-quinone oxidoreductase subunit C n=1 Tax=Nibricoccus sp. IMCC34717 TaxID=3034021 RepID=UPI003850E9F5